MLVVGIICEVRMHIVNDICGISSRKMYLNLKTGNRQIIHIV